MKKDGLRINKYGTKIWYKDGLVHREDGPAIIWPDGSNFWYKDDIFHRDDGPAIICPDGTDFWYKDGNPYKPSAHDIMVWKMNERRNIERATH